MTTLVSSRTIVYACGDFSMIGGQPRSGLAALDAGTGLATAWDPNPDARVQTIAVSGSTVFAGGAFTNIARVARPYFAALTSSLIAVPEQPRPDALALFAPTPNPVRSSAQIRFTLPAETLVGLSVYDVRGRRMATLLDRARLPGGSHEVRLDTAGWPMGCYFCRLESSGMAVSTKIVVLE